MAGSAYLDRRERPRPDWKSCVHYGRKRRHRYTYVSSHSVSLIPYIGKETARVCLLRNAKVYLACRSADKAQKAIEELKEKTGGKIAHFVKLDLADLKGIKKTVEEFTS